MFHEFIHEMRAGLASGELPKGVTARDPAEAAQRFAVYRNNVAHSLGRALAARFPVIERLVGDEFFRAMAQVYIAAEPPSSPILSRWGEGFANFLTEFPPVTGLPYLADVARLEWARGRAYHAADMHPSSLEKLAESDPSTVVINLHPSVTALRSDFAFVTIWQANQSDKIPASIDVNTPEAALILRNPSNDVMVFTISLTDAEFVLNLSETRSAMAALIAAQEIEPGYDPSSVLGLLARNGAIVA